MDKSALMTGQDVSAQDDGRVPAAPGSSSLRSPEPLRVSASGNDPSREYGKYGLPMLDEYAIETLAQAISCQGALNVPPADQQRRLRHALAAFMVRAQAEFDGK